MPWAASRFCTFGPTPHRSRVGLSPITSNQFSAVSRNTAAGLAELGRDLGAHLVVADADRAVQPGRLEHRSLGACARSPPGRRSSTPRKHSSQPMTSSTTPGSARSADMTSVGCRLVGLVVDRQEDRVLRRLARGDLQRHPRSDAERTRLVRRRRHDGAFGRVAAAADDHRKPGELGSAQHLDRSDELIHVHVQHPVGHATSVARCDRDCHPS